MYDSPTHQNFNRSNYHTNFSDNYDSELSNPPTYSSQNPGLDLNDVPRMSHLSGEGAKVFEPTNSSAEHSGANEFNVISSEDEIRPKLTVLDSIWNIQNAIQGMFVLSLPWAVLGWGCQR